QSWSFAVAMLLFVRTRTFETGIDKGTVHCSREKGNEVLHAEKGDHGFIVSGSYPGNYSTGGKTGLWCQVHIQVCSTCKLQLEFVELTFTPCTPHRHRSHNKDWCHLGCDHIHVYEVDSPYNKVTHKDYFSANESDQYTSISGNLKIRHCVASTHEDDGKRFKIAYKVLDKKEIFKGVVSQYGDVRGIVKSPNFPHGYALNGESFTFEIHNLDPYGHVRLTFDDWDIAPETKVKIYDGFWGAINHTTLERYPRPVFVSVTNTIAIVMTTGSVSTASGGQVSDCCHYSGFKAEYQFVSEYEWKEKPDASCSEVHPLQGGGSLSFSGSTDQVPKFYDCIWLIKRYSSTNTADAVMLKLREVLLGDGWLRFGKRNNLEIRNGVTSEAPLVARYTARNLTDIPSPIWSRTGLYIRLRGGFFRTDKLSFTFTAVKNVTGDGEGCPGYFDFLCRNLLCIDQELLCDGLDHCGDGSDESPAVDCSVSEILKHTFKWSMPYIVDTTVANKPYCQGIVCGSKCIVLDQLCDGVVDCDDSMDESSCAKKVHRSGSPMLTKPIFLLAFLLACYLIGSKQGR
ncbi:hypothetical protein Bpfe_020818, partial [Biomphalaria pfeifferi]